MPSESRGRPNRPIIVARTLCIMVVLLLASEMSVRALADKLPPELDNLGEVAKKRGQLDRYAGSQIDVIFMGESAMDAGADPKAFTAESKYFDTGYNAALLGAPLSGQASWFEQAILPNVRPRLVLQAVSPVDVMRLDDAAAVAFLDGSVEQKINQTDGSIWASANRSASDVSFLVRYRAYLRQPNVIWDAAKSKFTGEQTDAEKWEPERKKQAQPGYWDSVVSTDGRYVAFSGSMGNEVDTESLRTLNLTPDANFGHFDNLLRVYNRNEIESVVVIPPIALTVLQESGVDVTNWNRIAKLIHERSANIGVPVIDLTDAGFTNSDFHDVSHLNHPGAQKFSVELARRVDALCAAQTIQCS